MLLLETVNTIFIRFYLKKILVLRFQQMKCRDFPEFYYIFVPDEPQVVIVWEAQMRSLFVFEIKIRVMQNYLFGNVWENILNHLLLNASIERI